MAYVAVAARVLTGVVFLVAVVTKVRGFAEFERSVRAMSITRARPVARLVFVLESLVVVSVAVPVDAVAAGGLLLSAGLDIAFAAAIVRVVRRGATVSCRCFGSGGGRLTTLHAVRDALLAAVALAGVAATVLATDPGRPAGWLVAAAAGGFGALVVVVLEDVVGLFRAGPLPARAPAKES